MKKELKEYYNRANFANTMLDAYFSIAPNKIISDIGAGYGHMKQKIEAIGGVWQPFDYFKKMDYSIVWDLNNSCPSNTSKAGMVVFLEVLEHLANPLIALQHISNHMETNGVLILTTPNPQSSKNRINLLLKGSLYAFQEKHLLEHHVFTPWEHIVRFYLKEAGFEVLEYAIVDTVYMRHKPTSIKGYIKYYLERFIEFKFEKAKGMSFGIVAKKL